MTLKHLASLSCIALFNAACSAPTVAPPHRAATPYSKPIEVAVPRIKTPPSQPRPRTQPYRPQVQPYVGNGAAQVEDLDDKAPMTAIGSSRAENNRVDAESNRLDPYRSRSSERTTARQSRSSHAGTTESETSSAVMALMLRAKLDMLAGRSEVAIDKLERGLRIQPSNPDLWNKLAEAHFHGKNYQQAIAMAKKSLTLSEKSQRRVQKSNWHLIAKAHQKMGNMAAMKSAMRAENSL